MDCSDAVETEVDTDASNGEKPEKVESCEMIDQSCKGLSSELADNDDEASAVKHELTNEDLGLVPKSEENIEIVKHEIDDPLLLQVKYESGKNYLKIGEYFYFHVLETPYLAFYN